MFSSLATPLSTVRWKRSSSRVRLVRMVARLRDQLGVEIAVDLDHLLGYFGQERLVQAELAAEAGCPADDHAADVVAPDVAGHHAIGDQEGAGAGVVGDHPVGGEVALHLLVAVAGQALQHLDRAGRAGRSYSWREYPAAPRRCAPAPCRYRRAWRAAAPGWRVPGGCTG